MLLGVAQSSVAWRGQHPPRGGACRTGDVANGLLEVHGEHEGKRRLVRHPLPGRNQCHHVHDGRAACHLLRMERFGIGRKRGHCCGAFCGVGTSGLLPTGCPSPSATRSARALADSTCLRAASALPFPAAIPPFHSLWIWVLIWLCLLRLPSCRNVKPSIPDLL